MLIVATYHWLEKKTVGGRRTVGQPQENANTTKRDKFYKLILNVEIEGILLTGRKYYVQANQMRWYNQNKIIVVHVLSIYDVIHATVPQIEFSIKSNFKIYKSDL